MGKWLTYILVFGALLATVASAQAPRPSPPPHEKHHVDRNAIEQVEEKWRQAILKSDAAALEGLLDEDYVGITAAGTLKTKEQTLEAFRSGKIKISLLELNDRKIRFYGRTALVTGRAESTGTAHESDMTGHYRFTQVFIFNARGQWKLVSFEINRIREPKEHHEHEVDLPGY